MIKRQVFLLLLSVVLLTGVIAVPADAAGKGFYPDGQLKWEYLFVDGEISEAKWYDESGLLVSRETYVAGQKEKNEGYRADGSLEWQVRFLDEGRQEVTRFDVVGQITARYQTVDGLADGDYTTYYSDGQEKQVFTYRQGVLEGPARTFFASGQKEHDFAYSNNEVNGVYRTYTIEGTLLSEYTFSAGQLQ